MQMPIALQLYKRLEHQVEMLAYIWPNRKGPYGIMRHSPDRHAVGAIQRIPGDCVGQILFVCAANMCRSPMAEGLMQRKLEREGRAGQLCVASAGVRAVDGARATWNAITIMSERSVDIAGHRSRALTQEIVEDAALILTMEQEHAEAIKARFPQHAHRVYLLSEMAGRDDDIEDPVGGTTEDYSQTAQEIQDLIEQGYPRIMRLIEECEPVTPAQDSY